MEVEVCAAFAAQVSVVFVCVEGAWTERCIPEYGRPGVIYQLLGYDAAVVAGRYAYSVCLRMPAVVYS